LIGEEELRAEVFCKPSREPFCSAPQLQRQYFTM